MVGPSTPPCAGQSRRARPLPAPERRAALIAATLPLILRHGDDISTRQIAEAAGVAEGTIFRVFPDKESLIRAAIAAAFDPAPVIAALDDIAPALPLRQRMVAIAEVLQSRFTRVINVMTALGMRRPPDANELRDRKTRSRDIVDAVGRLLEPDRAMLRISPAEAARCLRLLVFSGTHPGLTDENPLTADEIVAILLDGVLARDSRPTSGMPC